MIQVQSTRVVERRGKQLLVLEVATDLAPAVVEVDLDRVHDTVKWMHWSRKKTATRKHLTFKMKVEEKRRGA